MQQYLNIGEMSRLFDLNVQTLRYYDKIGLFVPEYRADNNYRKYRFEQCYQLAAICHMRRLGYPLAHIAEILASRNVQETEKEMENRLRTVQNEQKRLAEMEHVLKRKLHFLKSELILSSDSELPEIHRFPPRYYMPIGEEDILYKDESFYLNPTIVFYDKTATRRFCAYLGEEIPKEESVAEACLSSLPEGRYLCAYHQGTYADIWPFVCSLRQTYKHLALADWSVHFNIVDQFVEKNADNYLTQVQIFLDENSESIQQSNGRS